MSQIDDGICHDQFCFVFDALNEGRGVQRAASGLHVACHDGVAHRQAPNADVVHRHDSQNTRAHAESDSGAILKGVTAGI